MPKRPSLVLAVSIELFDPRLEIGCDRLAKGTSLAVIASTAVIGSVQNLRHGNADLATGATVGISGMVTSYLFSQVAIGMSATLSAVLFAIFLLFSATCLVTRTRRWVHERPLKEFRLRSNLPRGPSHKGYSKVGDQVAGF